MGYIGSPYRVRSVTKQLKIDKFTRGDIKKAAVEQYTRYNKTLATFQLSAMQSYVSENVIKELKTKFGKTVLPPNAISNWDAQGLKVSILNYVVVQVPAPVNLHFAQATVRIRSNQKLVIKDQSGAVLLGSEEYKPVEDIWVLEKIVEKPDSPWIVLATSLEHPEEVAAKQNVSSAEANPQANRNQEWKMKYVLNK